MKISLCTTALILSCAISNVAQANCVGPVVNGQCLSGTEVRNYGSDSSYQGSSGQRYDYNLNNPADANRYSVDLDAQRRDQMRQYDTGRSMDQLRGQYGGGTRSND